MKVKTLLQIQKLKAESPNQEVIDLCDAILELNEEKKALVRIMKDKLKERELS